MSDAFIRSPEAVLLLKAYQDAWPQPAAALDCAEVKIAKAAMEAAAKVERRIVVKSVVPVR
jgi:hypothetical protein